MEEDLKAAKRGTPEVVKLVGLIAIAVVIVSAILPACKSNPNPKE